MALKTDVLSGLLGYRLRLAQQAVFNDFAARVSAHFPGLSPGRAGILLLVEANPGVTQSLLARTVKLDRSTLVGVLHTLQDLGLLERRRGVDRRTNGLWLTAAGRALMRRLRKRIVGHERRVAARLAPAERRQLLALLQKLAG